MDPSLPVAGSQLVKQPRFIHSMHILVLCHEYPPVGGGAGSACAALCEMYVRLGQQVTVLTMGLGGLREEDHVNGVRVCRISSGRRRKDMASPWQALLWAQRCCRLARRMHRQQAFSAAHAHFIMPAGIVACHLKQAFGLPYLITPHGSDVPGYNRERLKLAHVVARPWWRRICRQAAEIICPSQSLLALLQPHAGVARTSVIPYGFDVSRFQPGVKSQRILLCSRLVRRKRFHSYLSAIGDVSLPGWEIDLVGDGPMYREVREIGERCQTPVRFHGWIDNRDPALAKLYARAMIFVFPSEWENLPVALMEAMSAGCAVIAADVAGNPEVLGDAGYLVDPHDPEQLRRATMALAGNRQHCRQLGQRARRRVTQEFNLPAVAENYLDRLRHLQHNRASGLPIQAPA